MAKELGMSAGEFAELFATLVGDHLPDGWEITGLDIGEIIVNADHGQVFRLAVSIDTDEQ